MRTVRNVAWVAATMILAAAVARAQGQGSEADHDKAARPGPSTRIGTLSPDESRRAERARRRAAASEHAPANPQAPARHEAKEVRPQQPTAQPADHLRPVRQARRPEPRHEREFANRLVPRSVHTSRRERDLRPFDREASRPRTTRHVVERPEHAPRVGDVVPAGVPLEPIPGQAYSVYPGGYVPYPSYPEESAGPPPDTWDGTPDYPSPDPRY